MDEKKLWVGIAPSPKVLEVLDIEEVSVLALLAWSSAVRRPVTSADVAAVPDRDGKPLGLYEAKTIVRKLASLKIASVLGMTNEKPLSVFLGGLQPKQKTEFRPSYPTAKAETRIETGLLTTGKTPEFVVAESAALREAQARVETSSHGLGLVGAAEERLRILKARIALYERWIRLEPGHPKLKEFLGKKQKAVPEMEFQLERSRVKQAELDAEAEAEGNADAPE